MIVNIGTRVAPVNIAFSSSRSAALIERKMLQNTKLSIKTQSLYNKRKKPKFPHCQTPWLVFQYIARIKNNTQTGTLTKSIENTLQTCVDISNEYLHEYNTGVKSHVFCSLHQSKCAVYTMFLITFVHCN